MKNPKIKYRNGEKGWLLTTDRPNTSFCFLTMKEKTGCIVHHNKDGKYLGYKDEWPLDVVWVEGEE